MAAGEPAHKAERSYNQWCPIAAGLDLVGDRWVLLIVRELAIGDRRFTDLRAALPGIAPNLLTERLRALVDAGLVTTAELPPPVARSVYRLTAEGRRVVPVLRALARFGARHLEGEPPDDISTTRVVNALLLPWWRRAGVDLVVRVDIGNGQPLDVVINKGSVSVQEPLEQAPDVTLDVDPAALAQARQEGAPARADLHGSAAHRKAFTEAFALEIAKPARRR